MGLNAKPRCTGTYKNGPLRCAQPGKTLNRDGSHVTFESCQILNVETQHIH